MQYRSSELSAKDSVDERVDGGVDVSDPEDDVVDERGRVQLEQAGQRHPDEEGQPRNKKYANDDAESHSCSI